MLSKHEELRTGILYFIILLCIALFVRDIPYQPNAFNLTLQQFVNSDGSMGDPGSFATAAMEIANNGWISSANDWILNLWPPGFILLEALIIRVLGTNAPAILVLQIFAAALFSIVLALLSAYLRSYAKNKVAFVLPLLIFAFPVTRVFLLQPTGISLGESFAIGFFLISILLAIRSVKQNSIQDAVYAGLCLALSAYFRSQFEIILLVLTGWGILLIFALQLTRFRKYIDPSFVKPTITTIAVMLMVAHAATMPWRAYHLKYQGSPRWVHTASNTFGNSVMTTEYLKGAHAEFVVAGGGNLVCRIDPSTCGDTTNAQKLFVKTFLAHPVEWYSIKFEVIGQYWFSSVQNWVATSNNARTAMDVVTNAIILIALIAIIGLLFTKKLRSNGLWPLLIWFNASLYSAYFVILTVQQFEVRYFYFPKIAGLAMLLIICCLYFQFLEKRNKVDI